MHKKKTLNHLGITFIYVQNRYSSNKLGNEIIKLNKRRAQIRTQQTQYQTECYAAQGEKQLPNKIYK